MHPSKTKWASRNGLPLATTRKNYLPTWFLTPHGDITDDGAGISKESSDGMNTTFFWSVFLFFLLSASFRFTRVLIVWCLASYNSIPKKL